MWVKNSIQSLAQSQISVAHIIFDLVAFNTCLVNFSVQWQNVIDDKVILY